MTQQIKEAFLTSFGTYLPGQPIDNMEMENILGRPHNKPSRLRSRILKNNGIVSRHYAMNSAQETTEQNSELAAQAIKSCLDSAILDPERIDMLAVASTQGDLPLPGLASMVQAELGLGPMEILSAHGVCSSGMMALKAAVSQVKLGEKEHAVVCASELASRLLKGSRYEAAGDQSVDFEAEFLRWMLSDGAGATLVESAPKRKGLSLRIDWIEIISFASDFDLCMSCGTSEQAAWEARELGAVENTEESRSAATAPAASATIAGLHGPAERSAVATATRTSASKIKTRKRSWQDYPTYAEAEKAGALLIRQNLRILDNIVKVGVDGFLRLINSGKIRPDEIDHFLCHYSSEHFRGRILELFKLSGCMIPEDKWFTNLHQKGNTGCASMFIILDELYKSDRLKNGDVLFCVVPESGRFTTAYMKLTVVDGGYNNGNLQ